jgi:hypothetical protein
VRDVERINHYPLYELGKVLRTLGERAKMDKQAARELHAPIMQSLRALDKLLKGEILP